MQVIGIYTLVTIVTLGALLMWLIDEDNFPNYGIALWWAAQTVTTVGYGDVVPTSVAGRVVAGLVMFTGIALITVVSGALASGLMQTVRRRQGMDTEQRMLDEIEALHRRLDELGRLPVTDGRGGPPPTFGAGVPERPGGAGGRRRAAAGRPVAPVRGAPLAPFAGADVVAGGRPRRHPRRRRLDPGHHRVDRRAGGRGRGRGRRLLAGRGVARPARVPRAAGAGLMILALLAIAVGVFLLVIGGIVEQSAQIEASANQALDTIEGWANDADANGTSDASQDVKVAVTGTGSTLLQGVAGGIQGLTSVAFFVSFTLFSIFFLLKDGPTIKRFVDRHLGVPAPWRGS